MEFQDNIEMSEPGPSKDKKIDNDDEMDAGPSSYGKKEIDEMEIDAAADTDNSDDEVEAAGNVELACGSAKISKKIYELDFQDSSSSSDSDSDSIGVITEFEDSDSSASEPIYAVPRVVCRNTPTYQNAEPPHVDPVPYGHLEYLPGYWLLFTNNFTAWSKKAVKQFLTKHLKYTCYNSLPFPGVLLKPQDYRLMIRLNSEFERNYIRRYIQQKGYNQFFFNIPLNEIPVGSLESESEVESDENANFF